MSIGGICFVIAWLLFWLLGFHVVEPSAKYNLDEIAAGFVALGLLLAGLGIPWTVFKREG